MNIDIISSKIISDRAQRGGLSKVREEHIDSTGEKHFVQYICRNPFDRTASLTKHAADIQIRINSYSEDDKEEFI